MMTSRVVVNTSNVYYTFLPLDSLHPPTLIANKVFNKQINRVLCPFWRESEDRFQKHSSGKADKRKPEVKLTLADGWL